MPPTPDLYAALFKAQLKRYLPAVGPVNDWELRNGHCDPTVDVKAAWSCELVPKFGSFCLSPFPLVLFNE